MIIESVMVAYFLLMVSTFKEALKMERPRDKEISLLWMEIKLVAGGWQESCCQCEK